MVYDKQNTRHEIKAVFFDLGETLLDFGKISTFKFFRQGARQAYDFLKTKNQPVGHFEYYCWRNLILLRLRHLFSAITGHDFDTLSLLKKTGTKKGIKLNDDQWMNITWLWYEPLSRVCKTAPDIINTFAKLKQMGLKLGILSNTFLHSSCLEKHLQQIGILDFFDAKLYSYEFDFRKPDPRIFKAAAQKIGENIKNIAYIGDRLDKDVKPSLKLSMTAVCKNAYTNIGKKIPNRAYRIETITELPELIKMLNSQIA